MNCACFMNVFLAIDEEHLEHLRQFRPTLEANSLISEIQGETKNNNNFELIKMIESKSNNEGMNDCFPRRLK